MANDDALRLPRAVLRWGLFGLLVASPLPFGSVRPGVVLAVEIHAVLLGALAVVIVWRDPDGLPRRAGRVLVPALFLLAIGAFQLIPFPAGFIRFTASPTAEVRAQLAETLPEAVSRLAPQSLEPGATLDAVLRLAAYILIGLAAAVAVRQPRHLRQVALVVVVSAAFQALYGSSEYLTGHQHIFGYAKKHYADVATGTFINRNHFAGYLAMALPLALGLMLQGLRRLRPARGVRERLLALAAPAGVLAAAGGFCAALIWIGVLLSYSRGGLAAALAATAFVALTAAARRRRALVLAGVLLLPTVLLLGWDVAAPGARFASGEQLASFGGRLPVWQATLRMARDYLPFGSGIGTFESAFPLYRPPVVRMLWDHAHNDWLQSAAEGGPLALLALLSMLWFLLRPGSGDAGGTTRMRACVAAAIFAVALHSLVDFSLRIPANAVLLACLVGLACSKSVTSGPRASVHRWRPRRE